MRWLPSVCAAWVPYCAVTSAWLFIFDTTYWVSVKLITN
jgi:hypothetical protein